jgi:hypothetical protein
MTSTSTPMSALTPVNKTDFGGMAGSSFAQFLDRNPTGECWEADDTNRKQYNFAKSRTAAGAVAWTGAAA